jgi:hypothetical protein
MSAAEKKKPGATWAGATGHKVLNAVYRTLRLMQVPFCWGCWVLEQRASRLQDWLSNEGHL